MNGTEWLIPTELTDLILIRGYFIMGMVSIISIIFTLFVVFARNGSNTYKYLTAQSLISCVIYDIQLCFTMCPHLVMQQLNGYTLGFFSVLGVPAKWQYVAMLFSLVQMYSSAYICIIFRHQSILPFRSTLKLHSKREWFMTFLAFDLGHSLMCVTIAFFIKDAKEDDSSPRWLLVRNSIILPFDWSLYSAWVFCHVWGALSVTIGLVSFTFWHMNHTLRETRKFLSPTTVYMQRLAVIALSAQCSVPVATVILPLALHFVAVFIPSMDPNLTCYLMYLFSSNSIFSTIVIIFSTPDYRRYLFHYFSGHRTTPVAIIRMSVKHKSTTTRQRIT